MSTLAPTFSQIRAQVANIRKKDAEARVIGIHASGRWTDERVRQHGDERYVIDQCDSPLAMRIALREDAEGPTTKVLITGLEEKDLGSDILMRLAKRRLFQVNSWQIIQTMFQAHDMDPRLAGQSWIADSLFELIPTGDCPPAPGGFLDLDTVWSVLLDRGLGLSTGRPDLTAVLRWTVDEGNVQRFRGLPEDFREGAITWLAQVVGPATELVLRSLLRKKGADAVPIGLASRVIFSEEASDKLDKAIGKVEERFLGSVTPEKQSMGRWAAAATEVVRFQLTDSKQRHQLLARGDELLRELDGEAFAYLSQTSPLGFDQRLARFGKALENALKTKAIMPLQEARKAIKEHDQARRESRRLERVEMAMRLVRWLNNASDSASSAPGSFAEAAASYWQEGGFVDWARLSLRTGDAVGKLSKAYAKLFDKVTLLREKQSRKFAELLRDWTHAGAGSSEVIRVESILDAVVAPLAADAPVLLIVVDGMSVAVCRELLADVARHDWMMLCEDDKETVGPGVATIPSTTEYSRTSLLCGALTKGASSDEVAGFAQCASLLAHSKAGKPPVLFHKASLQAQDDASLAPAIRDAIAAPKQQVVGVVVNAVDDYLLKGEQIDTQWNRDAIKVLPALLQEAKEAKRIVVMVSDHGHILEKATEYRKHDEGERWHSDKANVADDELYVSGNRVCVEGGKIVAPWSEGVRYGMKKNGYHGGVAPQEMVLPIVVLASDEKHPKGWGYAAEQSPAWWDAVQPATLALTAPTPKPPKLEKKPGQGELFDLSGDDSSKPVPAAEEAPAWIGALLVSDIFQGQKKLAGRKVPDDDVFQKLLTVLEQQGRKMTSVALARALKRPLMRLSGLLAVMQRVLNLDGYQVLSRDEASDTIELDKDLLCRQFEIE